MAAKTQPYSCGAHSGRRYGSFAGKTSDSTVAPTIIGSVWRADQRRDWIADDRRDWIADQRRDYMADENSD